MEFQRLSAVIEYLQSGDTPRSGDLRRDAGLLAAESYGMGAPSVINIAALSLAMERLAVHEISGGAIRMVHSADLRSIPDKPPRLMQHAWLIESADLDAPLWGDTVCLGGYELNGVYYLVGFRYPDGAMVARWTPKWGSGEKDIDVPLDRSPLIDDVEGHYEWAQAAARFTLILALLLEAWNSPVEAKPAEPRARKRGERAARARSWSVVRIVLSRPRSQHSRSNDVSSSAGHVDGDRVPQQTMVQGHLRRIRYGPGSQETRWQWIRSYEARRWVAPKVRFKVSE